MIDTNTQLIKPLTHKTRQVTLADNHPTYKLTDARVSCYIVGHNILVRGQDSNGDKLPKKSVLTLSNIITGKTMGK